MKLSIIIATFNSQNYILNCLNSIMSSLDFENYEVIIVDNNSNDDTIKLVTSNFPHIKIIPSSVNKGFAKANNIGIKGSNGKYLCFLNPDVIVKPDCINRLLRFMEHNPSVGITGPYILNVNETHQRSYMEFPTLWNTFCRALFLDRIFSKYKFFSGYLMQYFSPNSISTVDVINGCCWLIRRTSLDTVGLLDESFFLYGEDIDWCKRFWLNGWKVVFYPYAKLIHFGGGSSSSAPFEFYIEMQKANIYYFSKYHNSASQFLYTTIVLIHHLLRYITFYFLCILINRNRNHYSFKKLRNLHTLKYFTSRMFSHE